MKKMLIDLIIKLMTIKIIMKIKSLNRSVSAWPQTARKLQGVANGAELILLSI